MSEKTKLKARTEAAQREANAARQAAAEQIAIERAAAFDAREQLEDTLEQLEVAQQVAASAREISGRLEREQAMVRPALEAVLDEATRAAAGLADMLLASRDAAQPGTSAWHGAELDSQLAEAAAFLGRPGAAEVGGAARGGGAGAEAVDGGEEAATSAAEGSDDDCDAGRCTMLPPSALAERVRATHALQLRLLASQAAVEAAELGSRLREAEENVTRETRKADAAEELRQSWQETAEAAQYATAQTAQKAKASLAKAIANGHEAIAAVRAERDAALATGEAVRTAARGEQAELRRTLDEAAARADAAVGAIEALRGEAAAEIDRSREAKRAAEAARRAEAARGESRAIELAASAVAVEELTATLARARSEAEASGARLRDEHETALRSLRAELRAEHERDATASSAAHIEFLGALAHAGHDALAELRDARTRLGWERADALLHEYRAERYEGAREQKHAEGRASSRSPTRARSRSRGARVRRGLPPSTSPSPTCNESPSMGRPPAHALLPHGAEA